MREAPAHGALDQQPWATFGDEVVDEQQQAAGADDTLHLGEQGSRVGHDGRHEHGRRDVEAARRQAGVLGVAQLEALDVGQVLARDPPAREGEHVGRQVDPGDTLAAVVMRQGEAGADADFENPIAVGGIDRGDRAPASRGRDATEDAVIDSGPAPVGVADRVRIECRVWARRLLHVLVIQGGAAFRRRVVL